MNEEVGTVVSTLDGPSPSNVEFVVVREGKAHRGQFVEIPYSEGIMVGMINDVVKTNRYFERAESVKEFESNGKALFEQFPVSEWEYLMAKVKPFGVLASNGSIKRASLPPSPGTRVKIARPEVLEEFLGFDKKQGLELGTMEFHDLKVKLNLTRLLQKHVAVLAMSGFGKCMSGDSKILLANNEQKNIGEIVDSVLEKNKKVGDGIEFWKGDIGLKTYSLNNGTIKPAKILGVCRRKSPEKMICIKTRTGKKIQATPEHLIPVFNGKIEWVKAAELSENDYLIVPRITWNGEDAVIDFTNSIKRMKNVEIENGFAKSKFGKNKIRLRQTVDKDFAKLLAYLLAEGHNTCKSRMSFTNENEKIQGEFARILEGKLELKAKKRKSGKEVYFDSNVLGKCLLSIGFTKSSWTKFIPKEILQSSKEILEAFLSAFIDCDGSVHSKLPLIEITLASKKLSEGIGEILTKLGVIYIRKIKRINEKEYQRLFISGSEEIKKLKTLDLKVDHKKKALEKLVNKKSNTNIDTVPHLDSHFKELIKLLRMPQPQSESTGINNYLYRRDNPSRNNLRILINCFERRVEEVENAIMQAKELYESIPKITEENALEIVEEAFNNGFKFKQIAFNSGVSSSTARRVVRGLTKPKNSVFSLAKNVLKLQDKGFTKMQEAEQFNTNNALTKIKNTCEKLGYSTQELCIKTGNYKAFLYSHSVGRSTAENSKAIRLVKELAELSSKANSALVQAKSRVGVLKQALSLNAFFDKIEKVEKVKAEDKFVYDLSVEKSNFTANNILVHNSHLTSVLIEELLERKKQDGRIAVVLIDSHGEYSGFAEPTAGNEGKGKDYSGKTKLIKGREIKIGVSKLNVYDFSALLPGLSAPQKRDLNKALEKLKHEMKQGLGPFGMQALINEIQSSDEGKRTAQNLSSWLAELEQLRLFAETDSFSISDIVKPGFLTIIDLSDEINLKRKQTIVSFFARKLFFERKRKALPPLTLVLEEAHQFIPEGTSFEHAIAKGILETIAREGRKFGISICLISQRPKRLSTTALSQCGTHIILRVSNPYDLKHIGESSEAIDSSSERMISSLRVGEALILGEAANYPVFFKVRQRKSSKSRHESSLEEAALVFEEKKEKELQETEEFL